MAEYAMERAASRAAHLPSASQRELKAGDPVVSRHGFAFTILAIDDDDAWCKRIDGGHKSTIPLALLQLRDS